MNIAFQRPITVFFFIFLHSLISIAQPEALFNKNLIFDQLPEELGLSQRTINCIYQDTEGFLWIGTWSGLIRYDGYNTEIFLADYEEEGRLRSNKITSITEDKKGDIWIGTRIGGLFKFDKVKQNFKQFSHDRANQNSLTNNNVWDVKVNVDGNILIATENGLNVYNEATNSFKAYYKEDGLSNSFITSLFIDRNDNLWATTAEGINMIQKGLTPFKCNVLTYEGDRENYWLHNYVYKARSVVLAGEEIFFFSTKKGLKSWDGVELVDYAYDDRPARYNFFRALETVEGDYPIVLVGSEMGFNIFDPLTRRFVKFYGDFNKEVNLSHTTVTDIFIDKSDVLWVATKKGINKFDTYDKGFRLFRTEFFDEHKSILTGIRGYEDKVWISTMGGGFYRFDQTKATFKKFSVNEVGNNDFKDFVQKIHTDKNGQVYLGTAGAGIYIFDPLDSENKNGEVNRFKVFSKTRNNKITDDYIMSFCSSQDGGTWVGTWSGGLCKIYPDGRTLKYRMKPFINAPIVTILEEERRLWVGSRGNGLYRVDLDRSEILRVEQYRQDKVPNSISSNFISSLFMDSKKRIWIGTEDGLNQYNHFENDFNVYKKDHGLISNEAIATLEDNNGDLWVSNWRGLTQINIAKNAFEVLNHFDTQDRLQGGFFYNDIAYADGSGKLFFGGTNGFNILSPSVIIHNPHKPLLTFSSLTIFDQKILPGAKYNNKVILTNTLNNTESISLSHNENSISIEFSALHFAAPSKNRYAYILEGFDNDWQYTRADRRFASYTNLRHGNYTFKVKASNNDGLWTGEPISFQIAIYPPWWKTVWAFIGYIVITFLSLILFRKIVIMRMNLINDLKLERFEKENIEKLNKAKLEFFTNISHEFRTPLTLILGPLERIKSLGEGGGHVKRQFAIINQNTQRLLSLVNQLLDFRKAETGNLEIKVAEGNFVKFVKEIKLSFDGLAEEKNIDFSFFSASNIMLLWYDRDQFEKVVFNLLSNAFNHVPNDGMISIKLVEKKEAVEFLVENSGQGIKEEDLGKIFDRFYSGTSGTGTGIGLALIKNLVKLHRGKIDVESEKSGLTKFTVTIPKGKKHFKEEEIITNFKDSEFLGHYKHINTKTSYAQDEDALASKDISDFDKILIVEDNTDVRSYLKSIFIENYIVLEAENGKEGLDLAMEEVPSIIISDIMMPIMDGIKMTKSLKVNVRTSHIPIILLTARTSLIFRVEGLENGADDYITKPFNAQELLLKIRNAINARKKLQKLFTDNDTLVIEPKKVTLTSSDEVFIQKALDSIETNMSNSEYGVEDFGRDVGLSRMQLYRKLKAMTGQSANEFIRSVRLKRAAQLIEQNELTVAEVTYRVGFSDLQYFRSCFKKQFGLNPSEYGKSVAED